MSAEQCSECGGAAIEKTRPLRISRGENSVIVDSAYWSCEGCPPIPAAEDGGEPTPAPVCEWVDPKQARVAELAATDAWIEKYNEPMPLPKRPGRKTAEPKEEKILLLLSARELSLLDTACGDSSRNEFIRQAISEKIARG